jgi:hypothetical protein
MRDQAYDGSPIQAGLQMVTQTQRDPYHSLNDLHEMIVIARVYSDEPGNTSRTSVEYVCRDLHTGETVTRCRRAQQMSGLEDGDDDVLRPASALLPGSKSKTFNSQTIAQDTDGDRVLVAFVDGTRTKGVILGVMRHARSAYGATKADGDRRYSIHKGTSVEFKSNGDYVITHKSTSKLAFTLNGDVAFEHKSGSKFKLLDSGDIELQPAAGKDLFIGQQGASENLVLGQQFKQFAADLIDALLQATYSTGMGPSGPMLPPSAAKLTALKAALDTLLSDMAFTQKEI